MISDNNNHYILTAEELESVVKLVIEECRYSWRLHEDVDMPVLGLRIDQLITEMQRYNWAWNRI